MTNDYSVDMVIVEGNPKLRDIDEAVIAPIEKKASKKYFIALSITGTLLMIGAVCITLTFYYGIGLWGNNIPNAWAFAITNFVFWIGIGHAGTLISAILYLLRQHWRNGVARFAEAMTIFAVMCAGIFPIIHTGRPWLAGYLLPYPNQHSIWPNFVSPLVWDVFAVSTYFTVSLIFWYIGLIPDFATLRDKAVTKAKKFIYSFFSLGWRHSNRHWRHYEKVYMILAGIATPLVLSVHTVVSWDFAASIIPGWHSTIFPPYFVAGAIFSGFAMVSTVLIFVRKIFNMEHIITLNHIEKMNQVILLTGSMVGYAYIIEWFMAWYSGSTFELFETVHRAFGIYGWAYWLMVSCNVIFPQLFWLKKVRRSIPITLAIVILVNVGMWFERFVIIVSSLSQDFLPTSWAAFVPTIYDFGILLGSFGLFFTLILLFAKTLPVISISELKGVMRDAQPTHQGVDHE